MTIHHTHHEAVELAKLDLVLEDYRKKREQEKYALLFIPVYIHGEEKEFLIRIDFNHSENFVPDVQVKSVKGSLTPSQTQVIQCKVEDMITPRFFKEVVVDPDVLDDYAMMRPPSPEQYLSMERNQKIKDSLKSIGKRIFFGTVIAGLALFGLHLVGLHLLGFHVFRTAHIIAEALLGLGAIGVGTWVYDKACRGNVDQAKWVDENAHAEAQKPMPVRVSDAEGGSSQFKSFIPRSSASVSTSAVELSDVAANPPNSPRGPLRGG